MTENHWGLISHIIYLTPKEYNNIMSKYCNSISDNNPKKHLNKPLYLSTWNVEEKACSTTGHKDITEGLGKDNPKRYTMQSWLHSSATNLDDEGCSLSNPKRHRQWKSNLIAEGYTIDSHLLGSKKMKPLLWETKGKRWNMWRRLLLVRSKPSRLISRIPEHHRMDWQTMTNACTCLTTYALKTIAFWWLKNYLVYVVHSVPYYYGVKLPQEPI